MRPASPAERLQLTDLEPRRDTFEREALEGLQSTPKTLPSKFFYDARGSELFEAICELEEYYLTRTELSIMEAHAAEMAARIGPECLLVEYGSGSSLKTRILLGHMDRPAGYVPIDISRDHLLVSSGYLQREFPSLEILPVCADYSDPLEVPSPGGRVRRTVVYFPGSTIGNFERDEAREFLHNLADISGPGGAVLIGVDLEKDPAIILAAYDDERGMTAAFNKNMLYRMNRELDADFRPDAYLHEAVYNEPEARIEMYLVSMRDQIVSIGGESIRFRRGERIRTEYSHKYSMGRFAALAAETELRVEQVWTDPESFFSVQYLTPARRRIALE